MNNKETLLAVKNGKPFIIKNPRATKQYVVISGDTFTYILNGKLVKGIVAEATLTIHGDLILMLEAERYDSVIFMRIHWREPMTADVYLNGHKVIEEGEI